jgi:hypothetical protein
MAKSLFKSLLLPGFFVSCAVFTGLIVILASRPSNLALLGSPQQDPGIPYQISANEQRDRALRSVGLAIIISVASGIVTAAVLRKWQTFHETAQSKAIQFGVDEAFLDSESLSTNQLAEFTKTSRSSFNSSNNSLVDRGNAYLNDNSDFAEFSALANMPETFPDEPLLPNWGETVGTHDESPSIEISTTFAKLDDRASSSILPVLHQPTDQSLLNVTVLESIDEYQYQRIKTTEDQPSRFAILFNGQYYYLSKVEKTRENALKVAAKLTDLEVPVVITPIKRGHAIWTWQANAIPEPPMA